MPKSSFLIFFSKRFTVGNCPRFSIIFSIQNLILILTFEDSNNALKCKEEIEKSKEFGKVRYEDNSKYVSDNNINTTYNHILYIEKKSRIGLSKINMITDTMYDYAKKFEGTFEEWGIGVIED